MRDAETELDPCSPSPALIGRGDGTSLPEQEPADGERRAAPRFTPLDHRAWLGFWEADEFVAHGVRLLDIGPGGALVETEAAAGRGQAVWFCLHGDGREAGCLPGRVVVASDGVRGRHRVRIAFRRPCPKLVLDRAIRGPVRVPDRAKSGADPGR